MLKEQGATVPTELRWLVIGSSDHGSEPSGLLFQHYLPSSYDTSVHRSVDDAQNKPTVRVERFAAGRGPNQWHSVQRRLYGPEESHELM
jgi:hypothetical protein